MSNAPSARRAPSQARGRAFPAERDRSCPYTGLPLSDRETSSPFRTKQFISFVLKLINRDLSTRVRLQMRVELIVGLHTGFAGCARRYSGTELLKVHADTVERETASAVGTFNSRQLRA